MASYRLILQIICSLVVLSNCGRFANISDDVLARIARYVPVSAQDIGNFRAISIRCNELLNDTQTHPFNCLMNELDDQLIAAQAGWREADLSLDRPISLQRLSVIQHMHRSLSLNPSYASHWPSLPFAALHVQIQCGDIEHYDSESAIGAVQSKYNILFGVCTIADRTGFCCSLTVAQGPRHTFLA